jgi:hypothetical protein
MDDGEVEIPSEQEQPEPTPAAPPSAATRTAAAARALSLLAAAALYARRVIDAAELSPEDWKDPELSRVLAELRQAGERIEEILP